MENFLITDEEKTFILTRRELAAKRKKLRQSPPQHSVQQHAQQPQQQGNRPPGWDSHCDPTKVHKGRITETHPLYWFETEIFSKISNEAHKAQHKLLRSLLGMPVQNVYRDRQYHALVHLEALWQQQLLPLKYKIKIEEYKDMHGIGSDFVHPEHKKKNPDYVHPLPKISRPWDADKYGNCDEGETFVAGRKYVYDYDKEIGYKYTA